MSLDRFAALGRQVGPAGALVAVGMLVSGAAIRAAIEAETEAVRTAAATRGRRLGQIADDAGP